MWLVATFWTVLAQIKQSKGVIPIHHKGLLYDPNSWRPQALLPPQRAAGSTALLSVCPRTLPSFEKSLKILRRQASIFF